MTPQQWAALWRRLGRRAALRCATMLQTFDAYRLTAPESAMMVPRTYAAMELLASPLYQRALYHARVMERALERASAAHWATTEEL